MNERLNQTVPVSEVMPQERASNRIEIDAEADTRARIRQGLIQKYHLMFGPTMRETDWGRVSPANLSAVKQVREWKRGSKGLLLTGPTGRMKTRAMVALIGRLMTEDGIDVVAYKAVDWFAKLQGRINYGKDEALGWVEAVAKRPIVYIDDLGQQAVLSTREEWSQGWWFDFCDRRIELGLPLLVTTNLTAKEIAQSQTEVRGDPLLRRLIELCEPVKFV